MITQSIAKDPRKYTTKVFAGFTLREIVCFGLAGIMAIGLYKFQIYLDLWEPNYYVCIPCIFPLFIGFFPSPIEDMPLEKYIWAYIKTTLFTPSNRPYEVVSVYREFVEDGYIEEDENFFPKEEEISDENSSKGKKNKKTQKSKKKNTSNREEKKTRKQLQKEDPETYMGYK